MSFTFTPKTEAQIQQEERERLEQFLWSNGDYPFEITSAIAKTSAEKFDDAGNYVSGGKPMIEMKVNIFNDAGKAQQLFDWLVPDGNYAFKFRHFAYATGFGKQYEAGAIDPQDFVGKTGIAKVGRTKATAKYPTVRNQIEDYILDAASSVEYTAAKTNKARAANPELDDELTF